MSVDDEEQAQRARCPACHEQRFHSEQEWSNHPNRGHGKNDGKWSKEVFRVEALEREKKKS